MEEKTLSENTIKTYNQIINKLKKDMNIKNNNYFINKIDDVINFIINKYDNPASQITYYSSIINLLNNDNKINDNNKELIINEYKKLINKNRLIVNENNKNNEKSQKELNNWMEWEEIINIFNDLYNKYNKYLSLRKDNKIDDKLYNSIQNMVILSFYVLLEPRRAEYIKLKYKNYDIKIDNYFDIDNKLIVLNDYKTHKYKNEFIIDLKKNKKLYDIIRGFIKLKLFNNYNSDYLFNSLNNTPIDNSQLAKRLNIIFNKNISVSMIRKIYLTNQYGNDYETIKNIKKTSQNMGNSINVILSNYIKK